jgi:formate hydrogenlyase subunit 3/multisubunit Na+/H+ antiporter MnhD subunit
LTLLFRDFLNSSTSLKNKLSKPNAKAVYLQSLNLLTFFLPFYLKTITFNQSRYEEEACEEEEEDFDIEFQSMIVQVLSLMSTLISLYPKVILKELKGYTQQLYLVMSLYSLKSPFD